MDCKIDYLSFNIPNRTPFLKEDTDLLMKAHSILENFLGSMWSPIAAGHSWERHDSKGFYHTRFFDTDTKISVFVGTINAHIYVEVGGQACDQIRAMGSFEDLCQKVATRTSRVDFAVDFESECRPSEFVVNNKRKSFKAHSEIFSETGETQYVGAWKSERFARVYRYNDPHPRSKLLRAEVVLRGDYAKQAMQIKLADGELQATLAAHEAFKWEHELWQPSEAIASKIVSQRSDKEQANTIRWLNGDVAAAVANAHLNSLHDAYEWFEKYVQPRIPRKLDILDTIDNELKSSGTSDEVSHSE